MCLIARVSPSPKSHIYILTPLPASPTPLWNSSSDLTEGLALGLHKRKPIQEQLVSLYFASEEMETHWMTAGNPLILMICEFEGK